MKKILSLLLLLPLFTFSQNVGISTNYSYVPSRMLDVDGNARIKGSLKLDSLAPTIGTKWLIINNTGDVETSSIAPQGPQGDTGPQGPQGAQGPQGTAGTSATPNTADNGLTISSNNIQLGGNLLQTTTISQDGFNFQFTGAGSVGIGNLSGGGSPSHKLHVAGGIRVEDGFLANDGIVDLPSFRFRNDVDNGMYLPATNSIGLVTNGTERIRILSTGSVGIGNISPNSSSILDLTNSNSGVLVLPAVTTANQPASPTSGMVYYNTTTGCLQYYNGSTSSWTTLGNDLSGIGTINFGGGRNVFGATQSGVSLSVSGLSNIVTYSWSVSPPSAATITGANTATPTVTFNGTVGSLNTCTFSLTVTGCTGSATGTTGSIQYGGTQTFVSSGSWGGSTFGTTSVRVECWGAGGGGGGVWAASSIVQRGGGGAGGGYVRHPSYSVLAATSYTVTVGASGTAGLNGNSGSNNGGSGGNSSFNSVIVAAGGAGGTGTIGSAAFQGSGGLKGTNSCAGCDVNNQGGNGANSGSTNVSGAGGGSAGSGGAGGDASANTAGAAGSGGGVIGSAGRTTQGIGIGGGTPGAGGSGGLDTGSNVARRGGAGGSGQVIVSW